MSKTTLRKSAGFTLIELLTVIAIIGILAGIIIPTVSNVRNVAARAVDQNSLSQIAKAAISYATDNRDSFPNPEQPNRQVQGTNSRYFQWAGQLAKQGGLNISAMYLSKIDVILEQTSLPPTVLDPDDVSKNKMLPQFAALPAMSFNFVGGLRSSDPSTTPLAYTRGLTQSGIWRGVGNTDDDPNLGTYKDVGGHVVFIGGNVQYFTAIENNLTSTNGRQTSNLRETVPNRSTVKIYGRDEANGLALNNGLIPVRGK
jgi:prepilin-type N-terminal cleavage/methylation domain-containing protein